MQGTTTPDRARALSRRTVLRGAGAAGALAWTAPVVQVVAMTPAAAAVPSDDGSGGTTPPAFRATTSGSSQSFTGAGQVGPAARSEQSEDGTQTRSALLEPLPPGMPVSLVVGASESTSTVDRAAGSASSASRTALTRVRFTVPVVDLLGRASSMVVEVTGLEATTSASVSSTGAPTAVATSRVASVKLGALPELVIGSGARTVTVPGSAVRLVLNDRTQGSPVAGTASATATALRVEGLPSPLGELVVAASTAQASLDA